MTDEKLYTLPEIAQMYGLSPRALADAARAEKMPHYRLHGHRYMTKAQAELYVQTGLTGPLPLRAKTKLTASEQLKQDLAKRASRIARKSDSI